jgi:hypothetical protein
VKAFRAGSGRIAQLVEQMTLNHRVPGSSPGAPTKLFKNFSKKSGILDANGDTLRQRYGEHKFHPR